MRVLCKSRLLHHHKAINALTHSLEKSSKVDIDYYDYDNLPIGEYDFAICWGVRAMGELKAYTKTKNCLVFENAYLNNIQSPEKEWVSLGWNGLNGRADFCNTNSPSDRWKKHFDDDRLLEYSDGEYILVPLQINGDQSLKYIGWGVNYQSIVENIRKFTDLPIMIKDHPTLPGSQPEVKGVKNVKYLDTNMPIEKAISKAKVVVTINSNAGVDAALAGKPVISLDKGSMVWDISEHHFEKINNPKFYDRTQWCNDIAYAQWHPSELESGEAWNHLKSKIEL